MWFYNFLIEITILFLRILSFFSIKIKFFLDEHTKSLKKLNEFKINPKDKRLLFHCASLREFEQAKPLIQKIKSNYPNTKRRDNYKNDTHPSGNSKKKTSVKRVKYKRNRRSFC